MKYRPFPEPISLSVVGFGCWAIGKDYWGDDVDDQTSKAAVHRALDLGVNWFDTAPIYGHGHADRVLVDALAGRSEKSIIATKVGVAIKGDHAQACSPRTTSAPISRPRSSD